MNYPRYKVFNLCQFDNFTHGRLLGNDFLIHGYPETLRLAHVLCTFTANEIVAVKHFLTTKHRIRIINRPDMHKILFGPFGKGEKS